MKVFVVGLLILLFSIPVDAQNVSGFTQITASPGRGLNTQPSISSSGTRIANDLNREIFMWFDDGQGGYYLQITRATGSAPGSTDANSRPSINNDGSILAFTSNRDLTPGRPGNPDQNGEIFLAAVALPE